MMITNYMYNKQKRTYYKLIGSDEMQVYRPPSPAKKENLKLCAMHES